MLNNNNDALGIDESNKAKDSNIEFSDEEKKSFVPEAQVA